MSLYFGHPSAVVHLQRKRHLAVSRSQARPRIGRYRPATLGGLSNRDPGGFTPDCSSWPLFLLPVQIAISAACTEEGVLRTGTWLRTKFGQAVKAVTSTRHQHHGPPHIERPRSPLSCRPCGDLSSTPTKSPADGVEMPELVGDLASPTRRDKPQKDTRLLSRHAEILPLGST
jgi:hypothetical protein